MPGMSPKPYYWDQLTPEQKAWLEQQQMEAALSEQSAPQTGADPSGQSSMNQVGYAAGNIGGQLGTSYAVNSLMGGGGSAAVGAGAGSAAGTGAGMGFGAGAGATTGAVGSSTVGAGAGLGAGSASGAGAGLGATGGASATGAASTGSTLGTMGSYAATYAPWLAAIYGAYRVYDKMKNKLNKSDGGPLTDSEIRMATNPRGIQTLLDKVPGHKQRKTLDPVFQVAKGIWGSSKNADQVLRDRYRKAMKKGGMLDNDYSLTLADGSKFDLGKDGSIKNYNVDFNQEGVDQVVGALDPVAEIIARGSNLSDKQRSDLAGQLTNAAMSGGGDRGANIRGIYQSAGLDRNTAYNAIRELADNQNAFDGGRRDAYLASIDRVFGVPNPNGPSTQPKGMLGSNIPGPRPQQMTIAQMEAPRNSSAIHNPSKTSSPRQGSSPRPTMSVSQLEAPRSVGYSKPKQEEKSVTLNKPRPRPSYLPHINRGGSRD